MLRDVCSGQLEQRACCDALRAPLAVRADAYTRNGHGVVSVMAASFSAGLVAFSQLQFSQIRRPPAHLFGRKIPYVIHCHLAPGLSAISKNGFD